MLPQNILIVRLGAIGDVLHCTPVSKALRAQYPDARLSWIVSDKAKDILIGNPYLDELVIWDKEQWKELSLFEQFRALGVLRQTLRAEQYDLVVDVHAQLLPGLITSNTGAPTRIGFVDAQEMAGIFYTRKAYRDRAAYITRQYLSVLTPLGITDADPRMIMPIAPDNYRNAAKLWAECNFTADDIVVVLNPATAWETKCWPPEYFMQLGNYLLHEKKIKILLTGANADIPLNSRIRAGINGSTIDIAGKTGIKDLAAIIQKCSLFITGDTGPLHIAAAVGTPTLSLFGPTDRQVNAPLGDQHASFLSSVPCRECRKRKCNHFICMARIEPLEVYQEATKLLQKNAGICHNDSETMFKELSLKRIPMR